MSFNTMANNAVSYMSRHNDITLAFFLVAIIGLMIIPLPTPPCGYPDRHEPGDFFCGADDVHVCGNGP